MFSRRRFLGLMPCAVVGSTLFPAEGHAWHSPTDGTLHYEFPSQDAAKVLEVVGASHRDLKRVKELVSASPALARCAWDWGYGDWETPLGAASHVGRYEIAEYLLTQGARPDIFTFAMMGNLAAVKAMIESSPGIQKTLGPHGITLMAHALNGGERATAVADYLKTVEGSNNALKSIPLTSDSQKTYLGRYAFGTGKNDVLEVATNSRGMLGMKRGVRTPSNLFCVEEHTFFPSGSPTVRIRFQVKDGQAVKVSVHDPGLIVNANRVS